MGRQRVRLAVLAIAGAVGIAAAQMSGWVVIVACAALAAGGWFARRRALAVVALAACIGGALALREANELARGRAALGGQVEDGVADEVWGRVRGPVERQPGEVQFVLVTDGGAAVLVSLRHDDGEEPDILPGDRAAVRGLLRWPRGFLVPGAARADRRAAARGVVALLAGDAARARWWPGDSLGPWRLATRAQRALAEPIEQPVLRALVTGDRGAMSERETARWRDSGAAHVLAVSGLHLAVVALLAFALVRRAWAAVPALALRLEPARAAALAGAPLAIAYTAATGASPSAVRSMWVVLLFFAGVLLDRRARLADALGAAGILVLAVRPSALWDPSVELSFAATAAVGIALGGRRAGWLRSTLTSSMWAWLATAPITAFHFGQIALAGPVANLVAVPATELFALPVGLAGALVAQLWPAGGGALVALAAFVTDRVSAALAHLAAWMPPLAVAAPDRFELALWCAALVAGALAARGPRHLRRRALAVLAAAALTAACWWLIQAEIAPAHRHALTARFLDVGQGDAALVEVPGGGAWLIDAGGLPFAAGADRAAARRAAEAPGREAVLRALGARHIRRLDLVVLSHPHPDHYRGLAALVGTVPIGTLWLARPDPSHRLPAELAGLLADMQARGTRIVHPPIGTVWRQGGAAVSVLAPGAGGIATADPILSDNDASLVLRIEFAGRRLLLAGDIEEEGEALLAARGDLAADLVKVPHHGSPTSSGAALVAASHPRWAVISCGVQNQFGFPHPSVVERWRAAGARVLRTDQLGTVTATVASDGRMEVASVRAPSAAE